MKLKYIQYRIKETSYLRYCGTTMPRFEPQYRAVILGIPFMWKNFDKDLKGVNGRLWCKQRHLAEHFISVMQDRKRRG